mmetsp:Transcript_11118/g.35306  ORF Transcript_11118/g.35306 Transcript_11118/m.35306 type:complete len:262 (+) Transcript_11118:1977-2762(+)
MFALVFPVIPPRSHLIVRTDNMSARAYFQRRGGKVVTLQTLAQPALDRIAELQLHLTVVHLPGWTTTPRTPCPAATRRPATCASGRRRSCRSCPPTGPRPPSTCSPAQTRTAWTVSSRGCQTRRRSDATPSSAAGTGGRASTCFPLLALPARYGPACCITRAPPSGSYPDGKQRGTQPSPKCHATTSTSQQRASSSQPRPTGSRYRPGRSISSRRPLSRAPRPVSSRRLRRQARHPPQGAGFPDGLGPPALPRPHRSHPDL